MASNKKMQDMIAARKEARLKVPPVSKTDPLELAMAGQSAPAATSPAPAPTAAPATPAPAPVAPPAEAPPPGRSRLVSLTEVDRTEEVTTKGFHMYPSRHRQLRDLAFIENRPAWRIADDALEEYVQRHYGASDTNAPPGTAGRDTAQRKT